MGKIGAEARSWGGCLVFVAAPLLAGLFGFVVVHMVVTTFMGGWGSDFNIFEAIFLAALAWGSWFAAWVGIHKLM